MDSIVTLFEERVRENKNLTPKMKDILRASLNLFSEKGYSNTSTKDLAKAADVAEGTIFKHFGSKENLLYATLIPLLKHTLLEEWKKQLQELNKNIEECLFGDFLKSFLMDKMCHGKENFKVMKILYTEYLYQDDMRENLATLIPEDVIKEINTILDYYKQDQQLVNIPNTEIFRLLTGTIMAFILSKEIRNIPEQESRQEVTNTIEFLVKGLSPENTVDNLL